MLIAYQGRPGAYSESAAYMLFGSDIQTIGVDSFEEIYQMVHCETVQGGVIPIENSTAGSILDNYDLLLRWRLPIVGEVKLRIEHVLMGCVGSSVDTLREVLSHPQALAQCSHFFETHPQIRRTAFFDTAGAAEEIAHRGDPSVGAIASAAAARKNELTILISGLENHPGTNFTRFFAIRKTAPQLGPQHNKTSIAFGTRNESGALYRALGCFARRSINLIRIESRPKPGIPWEYIFYLDFEGNPTQQSVAEALQELENTAAFVTHLGSYPNGEHFSLDHQPLILSA